jgi:aspartyl-tRNA(Asn)/glutamyl-tRNA(Gln) amidotransferase subunit B
MRSKEQAADYRYFPDPDLLPLIVDDEWIAKTRSTLPELPNQAFERFRSMYGLDDYFCELLTEEKLLLQYYDQAISIHNNPVSVANWITTELFGRLNKEGLEMSRCPISPENLAGLVKLIDDGVISGKIAKTVFDQMFSTSATPESIVESRGLKQISDSGELKKVVEQIIASNPEQVQAYRDGKTKMFGFFVGQVMRATEGKSNPQMVNELLTELLK